MTADSLTILVHLVAALAAGGLIGFERSYHGRPAGLRTHMLVSIASSMLMLVTVYQSSWFAPASADTVRIDPTRMAQGIMTGIGFLGAGVIFKEGLSVRGLTTAASIWVTAAIGILIGIGLYFAATAACILAVGTLSVFRRIELRMPTYYYAHHHVRFNRDAIMPEESLRGLLAEHGFTIANLTYRLDQEGRMFEYRMIIRTLDARNAGRLARTLSKLDQVREFRISPTGD